MLRSLVGSEMCIRDSLPLCDLAMSDFNLDDAMQIYLRGDPNSGAIQIGKRDERLIELTVSMRNDRPCNAKSCQRPMPWTMSCMSSCIATIRACDFRERGIRHRLRVQLCRCEGTTSDTRESRRVDFRRYGKTGWTSRASEASVVQPRRAKPQRSWR